MTILQPFDFVVYAWLIIALFSAAYVAFDQFRNNPEAKVMKWGFVLVTLYMGPIGLLLYVMADKEPASGTHERFVKPLWKQGVGSTVHCIAGDATGIIFAAVVTALLGFPMWVDVMVEYVFGFLLGLFIFQALFMRGMMGGSYPDNVRRSLIPELLSMNMMMAGMAPVMLFMMMGRDMRAMWPAEPLFWFVMSIGVTVGFIIAYPINVWLVAKGLKHGLMTVRAESEHPHHEHMRESSMHHTRETQSNSRMGHDDGAVEEEAYRATRPQLITITVVTLLALFAGMFVPAAFINLGVRAEEVRSAIMPPGMIMTPETPPDAMRDMAAIDPRIVSYSAPSNAKGDRILAPRIENGVKVFDLVASVISWNILPGVRVSAYAINRQVPGPRLDLTEGDHVRINFTNYLPEPATMHWHGLVVPNAMDGVAYITQPASAPGWPLHLRVRRASVWDVLLPLPFQT